MGGAISGKSRLALAFAQSLPSPHIFVATERAFDEKWGRGSTSIDWSVMIGGAQLRLWLNWLRLLKRLAPRAC
ncbi:MAG: hypothetical protein AAF249_15520 [Pseudomonadota bacterium]